LVILSYPQRKWKSPEDGHDHNIRIICIICGRAREQGKQYTKRILPGFLKPYCRVRLDLSLEYYSTNYTHSGTYDLEDACNFLGCIDIRTARRHLCDLQSNLPVINLELSQVLAHKSGFFTARVGTPDAYPVTTLAMLVAQVEEFHTHLYGKQAPVSPYFYSILEVAHVWFCGLNLSTSYVSKVPKPHDTS
jgi:hypothetical protein